MSRQEIRYRDLSLVLNEGGITSPPVVLIKERFLVPFVDLVEFLKLLQLDKQLWTKLGRFYTAQCTDQPYDEVVCDDTSHG